MIMVMTADATAVAVTRAPLSIPVCDRIKGLTARIYAHRGEGGEPGNYFTGWGRTMFFQVEEASEHASRAAAP